MLFTDLGAQGIDTWQWERVLERKLKKPKSHKKILTFEGILVTCMERFLPIEVRLFGHESWPSRSLGFSYKCEKRGQHRNHSSLHPKQKNLFIHLTHTLSRHLGVFEQILSKLSRNYTQPCLRGPEANTTFRSHFGVHLRYESFILLKQLQNRVNRGVLGNFCGFSQPVCMGCV